MSSFDDEKPSTLLGLGIPFNIDSISHDVRRNLAKVDPRLPEEIKNVTLLLKEEKNVLSSLQNIARERKQVGEHLQNWGKENSEDIADITEKMSDILSSISDIDTVLSEKYCRYRNCLKEIRDAEQRLHSSKEKRHRIHEEKSKLGKPHSRSTRAQELEDEWQQVNREFTTNELEVNNIRRKKLKEAFSLHMSSIFEAAERIAIIAGFGWELIDQFDATPDSPGSARPKYTGDEATSQIVRDCQIQLLRWQPPAMGIRPLLPVLTNTASTHLADQKREYGAKLQGRDKSITQS